MFSLSDPGENLKNCMQSYKIHGTNQYFSAGIIITHSRHVETVVLMTNSGSEGT